MERQRLLQDIFGLFTIALHGPCSVAFSIYFSACPTSAARDALFREEIMLISTLSACNHYFHFCCHCWVANFVSVLLTEVQQLRCFGDGWLRHIRTNSTCLKMYAIVVECCTLARFLLLRRCIFMRLEGAVHIIFVGSKLRASFASWHGKA
jgi:hypothetical protein